MHAFTHLLTEMINFFDVWIINQSEHTPTGRIHIYKKNIYTHSYQTLDRKICFQKFNLKQGREHLCCFCVEINFWNCFHSHWKIGFLEIGFCCEGLSFYKKALKSITKTKQDKNTESDFHLTEFHWLWFYSIKFLCDWRMNF